jgi:hypothetical protein
VLVRAGKRERLIDLSEFLVPFYFCDADFYSASHLSGGDYHADLLAVHERGKDRFYAFIYYGSHYEGV